ncbi:MAG TPA: transglycosylase family protein [Mycobacteriales bacterium]|nr:transglycosylase family protein [Mycobacteriales bacterium]
MRALHGVSTAVLSTAVPALLGLSIVTAPAASAATPSSGTSSSSSSKPAAAHSSSTPAGVTPHQWSRVRTLSKALQALRMCESGGRYSINTGNGYYGAYQFLPSTWHSLGYKGMPNHASNAVQDAAAARLHDRRGSWADWGTCGRKAARVHA